MAKKTINYKDETAEEYTLRKKAEYRHSRRKAEIVFYICGALTIGLLFIVITHYNEAYKWLYIILGVLFPSVGLCADVLYKWYNSKAESFDFHERYGVPRTTGLGYFGYF